MRGCGSEISVRTFFSRLRQGEFCPKSDIIILNELFTKGSDELVQIQLYSAKTGALRWYGITANVVFSENDPGQVFGTISDLTELKKREENFRKLERVLQTIKDDYIGILRSTWKKIVILYYITMLSTSYLWKSPAATAK